jgi:L-alanine-DL-glutamate epimerase-like enolase superfamily enzyme
MPGRSANEVLARVARESAGEDYPLMFDAWMSWDVPYFRDMARRLEPHDVSWIEEPSLPDGIDQLAEMRSLSRIPIAAGEHEYTRWGMHELLRRKAVDILQPDPMWAGGISEMVNICALASVYGVPVIPHSESVAATAHVVASQPPSLCPSVEYLVKWNAAWQFFLRDPIRPRNGLIAPDPRPGLGLVIDESKVEDQRELKLDPV